MGVEDLHRAARITLSGGEQLQCFRMQGARFEHKNRDRQRECVDQVADYNVLGAQTGGLRDAGLTRIARWGVVAG